MMSAKLIWRDTLTALGYDVAMAAAPAQARNVTHASKARGQSLAYDIVIDNSGQIRFTATALLAPNASMPAQNALRPYRINREQRSITTIMYALTDTDDLADVVREMERIVNL